MCLLTSALRASVNKSHIPSLLQNNLYVFLDSICLIKVHTTQIMLKKLMRNISMTHGHKISELVYHGGHTNNFFHNFMQIIITKQSGLVFPSCEEYRLRKTNFSKQDVDWFECTIHTCKERIQ